MRALILAVFTLVAMPQFAQAQCGGNKSTVGTLAGAAGGGLLGSQFGSGSGKAAMTIAGVLGGGVLGNQVGQRLDAEDCAQQQRAAARHQRSDDRRAVAFHDPDSGRTCREMQSTAFIRGERQVVTGMQCREPDGSWKFVD
ncbi:MAG: hypothetical protein JWM77_3091 [Rhodospirillales bacterium]|jgi:surface antigen|nr:hypothetical protein [Rhodospirillales bacterium]